MTPAPGGAGNIAPRDTGSAVQEVASERALCYEAGVRILSAVCAASCRFPDLITLSAFRWRRSEQNDKTRMTSGIEVKPSRPGSPHQGLGLDGQRPQAQEGQRSYAAAGHGIPSRPASEPLLEAAE
jgi:hypothetical protein